jgi:hypothetical protein
MDNVLKDYGRRTKLDDAMIALMGEGYYWIPRGVRMTQEEIVFQQIIDTLEALRALKPEDRSEKARRIQITITEYEKMIAYYKIFVLGGE